MSCGCCRASTEGSLVIMRENHTLLCQRPPEQGQQQPRVDDEAVPQADHTLALSTHCRAARAAARGTCIHGLPKRAWEKGSGQGHVRSEGERERGNTLLCIRVTRPAKRVKCQATCCHKQNTQQDEGLQSIDKVADRALVCVWTQQDIEWRFNAIGSTRLEMITETFSG